MFAQSSENPRSEKLHLEKPKKEDWIASLVVFVIALPLSLGIALASGGTPTSGLITAIIGGIVIGIFSGAPLVVSGPAAGLSALVFQLVQKFGLEGLAVITVLGGVCQILFGLFRAGVVFTWIPKPVLHGVLTAIGFIITLGQLHVLMGQGIPSSPLQSMATLGDSFAKSWGQVVMLCGALAIGIQVAWQRLVQSRWPALKILPGALPAVMIVTLLSVALGWEMPRVELAPLFDNSGTSVHSFLIENGWAQIPNYLAAALGLSIVASAETLLSARAIDVMVASRPGVKPANLNQELFAQGLGNAVSGMAGGLPMTGVMVRSAANVSAGARTRYSTMLHGIWLLVFVGFFGSLLTKIPLTALASVLVLTGIRLLDLPTLKQEFRHHAVGAWLWVGTAVAVVATDLLIGMGLALAASVLIYWKSVLPWVRQKIFAKPL